MLMGTRTFFRDCQEWEWIPPPLRSRARAGRAPQRRRADRPRPPRDRRRRLGQAAVGRAQPAGPATCPAHSAGQLLPARAGPRAGPDLAVRRAAQRRDRPAARRLHPLAARRTAHPRRLPRGAGRATRSACSTSRSTRPAPRSPSRSTRSSARPSTPGRPMRPAQPQAPGPQDRRARRPAVRHPRPPGGHGLHQPRAHPDALPQGRRPDRRRPRQHHQPPGPLHDRQPALQRQGADDPVRAAGLARPPLPAVSTQHYAKITPTTLAKAYTDAGYFARNVRTIEVLIDRDAVASGAAAAGEPWQHYDLGHGYCTYTFFEQCPHRMACARCDFYTPKDSSKAQLLEAKDNLQRMLAVHPAHRRRTRRRRRRTRRPRRPPRPAHRHPHPSRPHPTPARRPADRDPAARSSLSTTANRSKLDKSDSTECLLSATTIPGPIVGHRFGFAEDTVRLAAALRPALASRGVPERGLRGQRLGVRRRLAAAGMRQTRHPADPLHPGPTRRAEGRSNACCAPRGARSYPRFSREELGGRFLGLMAYPMPKG